MQVCVLRHEPRNPILSRGECVSEWSFRSMRPIQRMLYLGNRGKRRLSLLRLMAISTLLIGVPSGVSSASLLCPSPSRSSLSYHLHSIFSYYPNAPGTFKNRSCPLAFRPCESLHTVQTPPSQTSQSPI